MLLIAKFKFVLYLPMRQGFIKLWSMIEKSRSYVFSIHPSVVSANTAHITRMKKQQKIGDWDGEKRGKEIEIMKDYIS